MSYTIKIGDASTEEPDPQRPGGKRLCVPTLHASDAPSFPGDDLSGLSNTRFPTTSTWIAFTTEVGLRELFFEPGGLMAVCPGVTPLRHGHLALIRHVLDRYITLNPTARPGWCSCTNCDPPTFRSAESLTLAGVHDESFDGNLARLLWLEFWIERALKTAKRPALECY